MPDIDRHFIGVVAGDGVAVQVLAADRCRVEDGVFLAVRVAGGDGEGAGEGPGLAGLEQAVAVAGAVCAAGDGACALGVCDQDVLGGGAVGAWGVGDAEGVGDGAAVGDGGDVGGLGDGEGAGVVGDVDGDLVGVVAGDGVAVQVLAADRCRVEGGVFLGGAVAGGGGGSAGEGPGLAALQQAVAVAGAVG